MSLVVTIISVAFASLACFIYVVLAIGTEFAGWLADSHRKERS